VWSSDVAAASPSPALPTPSSTKRANSSSSPADHGYSVDEVINIIDGVT
jgi:hypothetical protein